MTVVFALWLFHAVSDFDSATREVEPAGGDFATLKAFRSDGIL